MSDISIAMKTQALLNNFGADKEGIRMCEKHPDMLALLYCSKDKYAMGRSTIATIAEIYMTIS